MAVGLRHGQCFDNFTTVQTSTVTAVVWWVMAEDEAAEKEQSGTTIIRWVEWCEILGWFIVVYATPILKPARYYNG
jgi:hypothetical protein